MAGPHTRMLHGNYDSKLADLDMGVAERALNSRCLGWRILTS